MTSSSRLAEGVMFDLDGTLILSDRQLGDLAETLTMLRNRLEKATLKVVVDT